METADSLESLRDVLCDNWKDVKTAKHLRGCLLYSARLLDRIGHDGIATLWRNRIKNMPHKMSREAIHIILLSAVWELNRAGLLVSGA